MKNYRWDGWALTTERQAKVLNILGSMAASEQRTKSMTAMEKNSQWLVMAGSRQCRHQTACRIPDIQPHQGTPLPFKLDDYLDRRLLAGWVRSPKAAL
jgi:hypothetical protein